MGEAIRYILRSATAADIAFAWHLYELLMRPLTEALLPWRAERQYEVVERAIRSGGVDIIVCDGVPSGWLNFQEGPDEDELHHLYVIPALQNHGIGTKILGDLQARAAASGKPLRLGVMVNNPACQLYERMGFCTERSDAIKHHMRWVPPSYAAVPPAI